MQASTSRSSMLIRRVAQRASTLTVPACCSCESSSHPSTPRLVRYAASKAKAAPAKKKTAAGSFNKKGKKGDAAGSEGGGERVEALKQVCVKSQSIIDFEPACNNILSFSTVPLWHRCYYTESTRTRKSRSIEQGGPQCRSTRDGHESMAATSAQEERRTSHGDAREI